MATKEKKSPAEIEQKKEAQYPGHIGEIDKEAVGRALEKFNKYREGKGDTENRIKENRKWFKGRYCTGASEDLSGAEGRPEMKSAWAFNSIINKHADAMDNIPTVNILPREESDQKAAERLSKIVPLVMDKCRWGKIYYDTWYDKLISGSGIYKIYWDNSKNNGLGDVGVIEVDPLNLYWEPGCEDIQASESVFHVDYVKNHIIKQQYPFMDGKLSDSGWEASVVGEYNETQPRDHADESVVYDWWYKKTEGTKTVVHLCKFCNGEVLWASENTDEYKDKGYYDHGKYPFIFDTLFPVKGSPFGFGYVDVMKSPQYIIDSLDEDIVNYGKMAGHPRWLKKKNCNVDIEQFANWNVPFIDVDGGQLDEANIRQVQLNNFPPFVINHWQNKIEELKETSGNRDFSQGGTTAGVTAASAIAALQEAGSKLSRDMIKTSYWAYEEIISLVVELIRQFYTEDRYFRIEQPNGEQEFIAFNNQEIKPALTEYIGETGMELSERTPEFDYKIVAQKMSPFQRESQNQLGIQLFQMGVFNPQLADQVMPFLDMMQFEGIDAIKKKVAENGQLFQQLQQITQLAAQMAQQIDAQNVLATGDPNAAGQLTQQVAAIAQGAGGGQPMPGQVEAKNPMNTGADGTPRTEATIVAKARKAAAERTNPR